MTKHRVSSQNQKNSKNGAGYADKNAGKQGSLHKTISKDTFH
jgi:hypothetical protein